MLEKLFEVDWQTMWEPSSSILEIVIRGTITYWVIFLFLRFFRRGAGQLGVSDVLLIILIADAAQNSMAGEYKSISEGITLIATLVLWDLAIDWLSYHSDAFNKFSQPQPALLIKDGVMQQQNMKKQLISQDDLISILREQGVGDSSQVQSCYLESSGNISVVTKIDAGPLPGRKPQQSGAI